MVETFSIVTVVAIAVQTVALVALHLMPTAYDPIFTAIIVASGNLGSTLEHRPAWHGVKGWLNVLPWVMTGGAVGTLIAMRGRRLTHVGWFERLLYVASILWFFIVAIELARIY